MIKQNGVGSLKLQAKPVGNATFRLLASHHSFLERRAAISEKNNNKLKKKILFRHNTYVIIINGATSLVC